MIQILKGNHSFQNYVKKCSRLGHSISPCPNKRYTKPLKKPNCQKQTFNQAMKGNQNLPNKQVTSNNMTAKPLPLSYCSRSNSRDNRDTSGHRNPNKLSHSISKLYYGKNNFKPPSRNDSPYPRSSNYQNKSNCNTNSSYSNNY